MSRSSRLLILAGVALFAALVVGLSLYARREVPGAPTTTRAEGSGALPPSPPKPAGPAELALIAPLAKGSDLGGFEVQEIAGVDEGTMRVVCAKEKAVVRLYVALADEDGAPAPATAGKFAVFYAAHGATPEDAERLSKKLASMIGSNTGAAVPAGMTTYTPKPKPATTL
jgi:hypothetical protein